MKTGFFYDACYLVADGIRYAASLDDSFWARYVKAFGKISVCMREKVVSKPIGTPLSEEGVVFHNIRIKKKPISDAFAVFRARKKIAKLVAECDFAVIRMFSMIGALALKEVKKQHKPYMIELVNDPYLSFKYHSFIGRFAAPFVGLYSKRAVKAAPYVSYVCQSHQQKRYPTDGVAGDFNDAFVTEQPPEVLSSRLSRIDFLPKKRLTLGLVGAYYSENKGHATALKTVARLRRLGYNVNIEFIGDGDFGKWEKLSKTLKISGSTSFFGLRPFAELMKWYEGIDVLLMPSIHETFGRVALEAKAKGAIVVGSANTAVAMHTAPGCAANPRDSKKFSEIIGGLADDTAKLKSLAEKSFYEANESTVEKIDIRRNEFYDRIIRECAK